jgi:ubiquinone/menaquinone biosynthesis C-methylase UbiE
MDHVHYETWEQYIVSRFMRYCSSVTTVLEIACGTGSLSRHLLRDGYRVTGVDISVPMLAMARKKLSHAGFNPRLVAADMTVLPFGTTFDAVICLYDSINYLRDPAQFLAALDEAARVTRPGGLYIFDVCTERNSRMFFSQHEMTESIGPITYHRTSRYDSAGRLQENAFVIESDGERIVERHIQRIYRLAEIHGMVAKTPFDLLGVFDDLTDRPGTEQSERVHFVLQRRGI